MKRNRLLSCLLALGFLLGIRDGYIALWEDGCEQPREVFPCRAELLPEADQRSLEKGIRLENELELAQALEDYLS